jgi:hypothetical protein
MFENTVDEPQRARDGLERLLDGGMVRGLLLQQTERAPRRFERGRCVGRRCGSAGLFDLKKSSHRVGDGFGNAHHLRGNLGVGLDRPQRSGKSFASGFRSRDGIGHEPS